MVAKMPLPLSLLGMMSLTAPTSPGILGSAAASGLRRCIIPAAAATKAELGRRKSWCAFCSSDANVRPRRRSFADRARPEERRGRCVSTTLSPRAQEVVVTSRRISLTSGIGPSGISRRLCGSMRLLATSSEVTNVGGKRMDEHVAQTVPSVGAVSRVCVMAPEASSFAVPDDDDDDDDDSGRESFSSDPPALEDVRVLAESLAANLSLPLLVEEDGNDGEEGGTSAEEEEAARGRTGGGCTHCLRVVPYERESVRSYAIAIQPLDTGGGDDGDGDGGGGGGKGSRRRSRQRQRQRRKSDRRTTSSMKPFFVDFVPPAGSKMDKRLGKNQKGGSELLLKAVAPGKVEGGAVVYDLTAGFGQDSAIVAAAGGASRVHMVERDPVVAALLGDALRRLRLVAESDLGGGGGGDYDATSRAAELASKLTLEVAEGVDVAMRIALHSEDEGRDDGRMSRRPDVCYLDPMFPPRTKSAAVKKNMQILHGLLRSNDRPDRGGGEACDDAESSSDPLRLEAERSLLDGALRAARVRVVVKRPAQAPPLGGDEGRAQKPSYSVRGSVNRWDIYVKQ